MLATPSQSDQSTDAKTIETQPGSYFVSNYPPYSEWQSSHIPAFRNKLDAHGDINSPLGQYFHIPFCRKRCNFCYFKVYTDKKSTEIDAYLRGIIKELQIYAEKPQLKSRNIDFVYFGGGTPSCLSVEQLKVLCEQAQLATPWDHAREISFEAEPGTLNSEKLVAIKQLGITRLSLGVESFSDQVLAVNNRSHKRIHILNSYTKARELDFDQVNIDLIAGLPGETRTSWDESINSVLELEPDSVTIYQLEVPFNTILYKQIQGGQATDLPLQSWSTKSIWVKYAFDALEQAGYTLASAYTAVKSQSNLRFIYRDALWHGADLMALGVASFGHFAGSLYQNEKDFGHYLRILETGKLPVHRCYELSRKEAMVRQFILQLKLGKVKLDWFSETFGVHIDKLYQAELEALIKKKFISIKDRIIIVERIGLLQVDAWLENFYCT